MVSSPRCLLEWRKRKVENLQKASPCNHFYVFTEVSWWLWRGGVAWLEIRKLKSMITMVDCDERLPWYFWWDESFKGFYINRLQKSKLIYRTNCDRICEKIRFMWVLVEVSNPFLWARLLFSRLKLLVFKRSRRIFWPSWWHFLKIKILVGPLKVEVKLFW